MMRITLFAVMALFLPVASLQAQRFEPGDTTLNDYRPDGELRMWTFVVKDSTIGRLFSTVQGHTEVNGVEAYIIEQRLGLDFTRVGSGVTIDMEGRQLVASDGSYLGCELRLTTGDQAARVEIERDGDTLYGSIEQGGRTNERRAHFSPDGFAADVYLLDMHELFLAMRDISVGDTIADTMFIPQLMSKQYVHATVNFFLNKQVYKGAFDSTFVVVYSQPQTMAFYFTPDKRLVKVEIPGQQLKAYLDVVRQFSTEPEGQSNRIFGKVTSRLPVFVAYLILGSVAMLLFAGRACKRSSTWLALLVGSAFYLPVLITQMPLQTLLVEHVFIPRMAEGGSPYFWGMFPALTTGVIQELLKAVALIVFILVFRQRTDRQPVFGAACGAGFGIIESCHLALLAVNVELISWHLLERGFMILFHVTAGALLGYGLVAGFKSRRFLLVLLGMVLFDAFLRYLPVFVRQGVVEVWMMYFVIPLLTTALAFFALWRSRRSP